MEEELLSAVVADEPEPFVVNDPFDPSLRHNALLSSLSSLSSLVSRQEQLSAITAPGYGTLRLTLGGTGPGWAGHWGTGSCGLSVRAEARIKGQRFR